MLEEIKAIPGGENRLHNYSASDITQIDAQKFQFNHIENFEALLYVDLNNVPHVDILEVEAEVIADKDGYYLHQAVYGIDNILKGTFQTAQFGKYYGGTNLFLTDIYQDLFVSSDWFTPILISHSGKRFPIYVNLSEHHDTIDSYIKQWVKKDYALEKVEFDAGCFVFYI